MDINSFEERAGKLYDVNRQFIKKLRHKKPKNLDEDFHELHEEVFDYIDCMACANCCKTTSPVFYDKDIDRLSKRLRVKPSVFIDKYLKKDSDNDYVLKQSPCAFLSAENQCIVYEDRPRACKEYPHTNRKRIYQILDLTLKNTKVCPATFEIIEKLRKKLIV